MPYRFVTLLLILAVRSGPAVAQGVPVVDYFIDPAGKVYLLLADSRLVTRNNLGQTVNDFYDSSLGYPDLVDVTNPFSILLYYEDFGRIVILDRTLSEISRVDLFAKSGLQQPGAVARANDNQIWVYDTWDYRLKLLDNQGGIERETNNLRLELGVVDDPDAIYVDRGRVALYFADLNRLALLTNFGQFQRWVELPPTEHLSWQTPYLTGYDGERSWRWVSGARTVTPWARPQVPGSGEGKRTPVANGYHYLLPDGTVSLRTLE